MFFLLFVWLGLSSHAGVFMTDDMRAKIDKIAMSENEISGSAFLENEHSRILNYLDKYASHENGLKLKGQLKEYCSKIKGEESFGSLFLVALLSGVELSMEFERKHLIHPVNTTQNILLKALEETNVENFIRDQSSNLPPHLKYFKPGLLLDYGTFALEEYFYGLSQGVALFTLPGTSMDDVHAGIFKSPLEVFNHDANHLYDTFGYNDENLARMMQSFSAHIIDCKNRNPHGLEGYIWQRAFFLLFVLSHEPPIFAKLKPLAPEERINIPLFIKFLEENIIQYFENNFRKLSSINDFYASSDPAIGIKKIEKYNDGFSASITYSDGLERHCSMLNKYENIKTLYCDYAKFLKFILPDQEHIEGTDSELNWNPDYVIKKYHEAFEWFWKVIGPSLHE